MKASELFKRKVNKVATELQQRRRNHLANVELLRQKLEERHGNQWKNHLVSTGALLGEYEDLDCLSENKVEQLLRTME